MDRPVLEGIQVVKNYGGLRAVDGISFAVRPGEILGIVGPNGAGKTTLFDVITGHTTITAGDVVLEGTSIRDRKVHERSRAGLARTFQQPVVARTLTVLENAYFAAGFRRGRNGGGRAADVEQAVRWLRFAGLGDRLDDPSGSLGVFDTKRLMLATALAAQPVVLLLDEPFGGLNPGEIDEVIGLVRRLRDEGLAVVVIEHVMRALTSLADRVLVMHHGAMLFEGSAEAMLKDERVIDVYLGRSQRSEAAG